MGRRKERRLAAISAAGRRVKLDLTAEPSGDLGGFFGQDEVGEDGDTKTHAEFQSSQASSGQLQPNTLQLLEQYSDEDSDEGHTEHKDHAPAEDASNCIKKAKNGDKEETDNGGIDDAKELNNQVEQFLRENFPLPSEEHSENIETIDKRKVDNDDFNRQSGSVTGAVNHAGHDNKCVESIISGWKMVLHEESNCYYFWNVSTGETSWEMPDVLSQGVFQTSENGSAFNAEGKVDSLKEIKVSNEVPQMDSVVGIDGSGYSVENGDDNTLSSTLMKKCENLAERLKSAKSLNPEGHQCVKYLVEIDIRHGDIKALASCGSHLLPFWLHIEAQLNNLENGIDSLIQYHDSTSLHASEDKADIKNDTDTLFATDPSEKLPLSSYVETSADSTMLHLEVENHYADISGLRPAPSSTTNDMKVVPDKNETEEFEKEDDCDVGQGLHAGEDVEMDVDMEVEDMPSVDSLHVAAPFGGCSASVEQYDIPDRITDREMVVPGQAVTALAAGEWIPPPPPDEESVPPPPPDDDPCPPPPHNEALDSLYALSQLGSFPPFQHSGEYNVSYPVHNLQYYGQADIGIGSASLYAQPEAGHMSVSHYYDPATNAYAITPLVATPVEPMTYYTLQGQPFMSGTSGTTTGEPVPGAASSSLVASLGSVAEMESGFSVNANPKPVKSEDINVKSSTDRDIQSASGNPETSLVTSSVTMSSASGSTTSAAASKAQSQSKAVRSQKRAVSKFLTLRTNKKVSGLVDKWKAVKEELTAEDEEPEDAYEILEKKRQREIEEWRANQIASGAAKDNANFQPLGGDWRERVKRRKAETVTESEEKSSGDVKQKPDLVELAKGLPSGWQAYWDESSKHVYYGNLLTSKTTWTRPKV